MTDNLQSCSDELLVQRALVQESRAFEVLVHRHFEMVFAVALARLRDPEQADELAQEVFIRAYLNLSSLKLAAYFPAWLCRMTRNLATDWGRRGQTASRLLPMVPIDSVTGQSDPRSESPRSQCESRQEHKLLHAAMARLGPADREVVLLHFSEGLTKSEIARRLDLNPSSIGRQLDRALDMLRRELGPSFGKDVTSFKSAPGRAARASIVLAAVAAMSPASRAALAAAATAQWGGAAAAASGFGAQFTTAISIGGVIVSKATCIAAGTACLIVLIGVIAVSQRREQEKFQSITAERHTAVSSTSHSDVEPVTRVRAAAGQSGANPRGSAGAAKARSKDATPLPQSIEITGVVESPDGMPVSGARILPGKAKYATAEVTDELTVLGASDSAGRFVCNLPRNRPITVRASAAGFRSSVSVPVNMSGGKSPASLVLKLRPSHYLAGTIRHTDGNLAAGTTVTAVCWDADDDSSGISMTDSNGRYRIDGLSERSQYVGMQSAEFGEEAGGETTVDRADADFTIGTSRQRLFLGMVVDWKSREPVPDFTVSCIEDPSLRVEKVPGEAGVFQVPNFGRSKVRFRIESPGYAPAITSQLSIRSDRKVDDRVFAIGPSCLVTGRILDASTRKPVSQADVLLNDEQYRTGDPRNTYAAVKTDAEGRFRFETGQTGSLTLIVNAPGMVAAPHGVKLEHASSVDAGVLELYHSATLRLNIFGLPKAISSLNAYGKNGYTDSAKRTEGGAFEFANLYPDTLTIHCGHSASLVLDIKAGEKKEHSWNYGTASIVGTINLDKPIHGYQANLEMPGNGYSWVARSSLNEKGLFEASNLPAGVWMVTVSDNKRHLLVKEHVSIDAGQRIERTFEVKSTGEK